MLVRTQHTELTSANAVTLAHALLSPSLKTCSGSVYVQTPWHSGSQSPGRIGSSPGCFTGHWVQELQPAITPDEPACPLRCVRCQHQPDTAWMSSMAAVRLTRIGRIAFLGCHYYWFYSLARQGNATNGSLT